MNCEKSHLFAQFLHFILVSGIGFLIDFTVYYLLTEKVGMPIAHSNMLSAFPAITWVFLFSTQKIFQKSAGRFSLGAKYLIYLLYQAVLLVCVSYLAQYLYGVFYPLAVPYRIVREYLQLLCKCLITPITMLCNFFVMKNLTERV